MRYVIYILFGAMLLFALIQTIYAASALIGENNSIRLMGVIFFAPFTMIAALSVLAFESVSAKRDVRYPVLKCVSMILLISQLALFVLG